MQTAPLKSLSDKKWSTLPSNNPAHAAYEMEKNKNNSCSQLFFCSCALKICLLGAVRLMTTICNRQD